MSAKLKEFGYINYYNEVLNFLSGQDDESEIKNYIVSTSGYGDLICFGYEKKLMIVSLNYSLSKNSDNANYIVIFQDFVCEQYSEESISSILVIPMASQKQSCQGFPDWSCICIGFSSGLLKFYDQGGQLIFTQKLYDSRIEQIKLHCSPCYNSTDLLVENLMVLCDICCFQIDGSHLYESLNMFKKQVARFQAGFSDQDLETFQLTSRKWLFDSHEIITDIIFGCETSESVLDNIFNNAYNKGPFASVPEQVFKFMNCVTVGKSPFVMFSRLPLEADPLDMGDLAQAVFSKVKGVISTSFSSWLGGTRNSNKPHTNKKPENTFAEIPSRFQLRNSIDEHSRKSISIIGCPHNNTYSRFAAMTDDFGRIFLLDIDAGVIVRIWKGYRDAQISISTTSMDRHVNYLIIYAPRRAMIEIWTIPFGDRVASFDMRDRYGRLIHIPHGVLGSSRCLKNNQKIGNFFSTFFLDSTGKISVLEIPFHLSLVNSSNERSQDHIVLKHFKHFLREQSSSTDLTTIQNEFSLTLQLLKLVSSIDLLISCIISLSYLPIDPLILIFDDMRQLSTSETLAPSSPEKERFRLKKSIDEILLLLTCYKKLSETWNTEVLPSDDDNLESLLNLDSEDSIRVKKQFELYCRYHKPTNFLSLQNQNYHLFINNFTAGFSSINSSVFSFQLKKHVLEKDLLNIGCAIFQKCVMGQYKFEATLNLIIEETKLDQVLCFKLCMIYLIHESVDIVMSNLRYIKPLLSAFFCGNDSHKLMEKCLIIAYDICEKSTELMTAFLLSMIIRVIICECLQNISESDPRELKFVSFLTESLVFWNTTCQRLEDLSIFNCLLKCQPLTNQKKKVKRAKVSFIQELTLAYVMENGNGVFSESFAKWAFKWNLTFIDLHQLYKSLGKTYTDIDSDAENLSKQFNLSLEIKDIFAILYKQLPHSLEYDTILINVAWEYARLWSKTVQRIEYLELACELLENVGPVGGLVVQGIGRMIWDIHVKGCLESFFSNKSDTLKYTSSIITSTVKNAIQFLKIVLYSLENIDVMPTFSSETVWKIDKSRSSLIEMAVTKEALNDQSIELHIQLLYAVYIAAMVNIDHYNCQQLYSTEARKYFFDSLTKAIPPEIIQNDLIHCKSHRMRFIERVISSCTALFSESTDDNYLCQTVHEIIKILSAKWHLSLEDIRLSWIVNFYKCGLDSQAAMYLDKVENTTVLASNLLEIVGQRIKKEYLVPNTRNHRECFKYVTPQLNKWLQNIGDLSSVKDSSLQQSSILMDQILEWLPENSYDFEAATCLHSLILNIAKTKKYIE